MKTDIVDRMEGALLGVAIGDAMGMPVEQWTRRRIQETYGTITDFFPGNPQNQISSSLKKYETTDDTLCTVLVAQVLCEGNGNFRPERFLELIDAWMRQNDKSRTVIGPSTRKAVERMNAGDKLEELGKSGVTNGAAMKIIPAGLVVPYRDEEALFSLVSQICLPTHNTDIAIEGAFSVAVATAYVLESQVDSFSPDLFIEHVISSLKQGRHNGYSVPGPSVAERILIGADLALKTNISDAEFLDRVYSVLGTSLSIAETVSAAFAIVLRAKGDIMKTAMYSANVGGDTDTIGAIASGICGALQGAGAIPQDIKENICAVNKYDFQSLAHKLAEIRGSRMLREKQ